MKSLPTNGIGPFRERVYFKPEEVDSMCIEALRTLKLLPSKPEPIRIDRFIEQRFGVGIEYKDLSDGLLGYTEFGKNGVRGVVIDSSFDREGTSAAEHRLRSTLAHEGGHGLMHTHLFCLEPNSMNSLFADYSDLSKPKVLCRDQATEKVGYGGQWWEYQANMAIGSLLLPKPLLYKALEDLLESTGKLGTKNLPSTKTNTAVEIVATTFNVSRAVARIRIDEIWPPTQVGQMQL